MTVPRGNQPPDPNLAGIAANVARAVAASEQGAAIGAAIASRLGLDRPEAPAAPTHQPWGGFYQTGGVTREELVLPHGVYNPDKLVAPVDPMVRLPRKTLPTIKMIKFGAAQIEKAPRKLHPRTALGVGIIALGGLLTPFDYVPARLTGYGGKRGGPKMPKYNYKKTGSAGFSSAKPKWKNRGGR